MELLRGPDQDQSFMCWMLHLEYIYPNTCNNITQTNKGWTDKSLL